MSEKWDRHFFKEVYLIATLSKDIRTKIGAVIVNWAEKDIISKGYNGFPKGVNDDVYERQIRPEKYFYVVHGEHNAILHCARSGRSCKGCVLITNGIPCDSCTKALIQGGISEVVVHKQWQDYERKFNWEKWNDSSKRSEIMLNEAGVKVRVFDGVLGVRAYLDANVIDV